MAIFWVKKIDWTILLVLSSMKSLRDHFIGAQKVVFQSLCKLQDQFFRTLEVENLKFQSKGCRPEEKKILVIFSLFTHSGTRRVTLC